MKTENLRSSNVGEKKEEGVESVQSLKKCKRYLSFIDRKCQCVNPQRTLDVHNLDNG